jgi:hypothetical protein
MPRVSLESEPHADIDVRLAEKNCKALYKRYYTLRSYFTKSIIAYLVTFLPIIPIFRFHFMVYVCATVTFNLMIAYMLWIQTEKKIGIAVEEFHQCSRKRFIES